MLPLQSVASKVIESSVERNYQEKERSEKQVSTKEMRRKKITIAEESTKELVPVEQQPNNIRLVKNNSVEVIQSYSLSRPDTSYIYCSEAQQVHSTASLDATRDPQNIALLIPSSVLNATLDPRMDNSLLEVTCQVLNLHLWPMSSMANRTMNP